MVSKESIHIYIRRHKPKPALCEFCQKVPSREVANLKNHHYTKDINDYAWLCHRCHQALDKTSPPQVYDWNGKHHRPESIKKMSLTKQGMYDGKNNPFFGKHHTDEVIQKNRDAHLGKPGTRLGCHHTIKSRLKISLAMMGKIPWNKGKHGIYSEETKRKMVRKPIGVRI